MNVNKCSDSLGCRYSEARDQELPRRCMRCAWPENSAINHEKYNLSNTFEIDFYNLSILIRMIDQRNQIIREKRKNSGNEYFDQLIENVNEQIKRLLQIK